MKEEAKDYWECEICGINSYDDEGRMIPCPRGGCEAKIKGKIVITTEIILK